MPRITIDQPLLRAVLDRVVPFVPAYASIPILTCIKLSAGDGFTVTANNLDAMARLRVSDCEIEGEGDACISGASLLRIVRALDAGARVTLSWGRDADRVVRLECLTTGYDLHALPAADFPAWTEVEAERSFTVPVPDAQKLFGRPAFAISTEETRYYFNGICLSEHAGALRAVATDGHRLAAQTIALPEGAAGMPGIIVPEPIVRRMQALLKAPGLNGLGVTIGGKQVWFDLAGLEVRAKLIDGRYADVDGVIPGPFQGEPVVVDKRFLMACLKRVGAFQTGRLFRCLKLEGVDGELRFSMAHPDYGAVTDRLPMQGDGFLPVGINLTYLLEAVRAVDGYDIRIEIIDPGAPMRFQASGDFFVIQMPMRV